MTMLFLFNFLTCLMITFVAPSVISGPNTQVQTWDTSAQESGASNVQISVGTSGCSRSSYCSSKKISYIVGTQKVTWHQAFVLCKQAGMELASITSIDEENILENYTKTLNPKVGFGEGYWTAGTRNGACNSDFVWLTTGQPVIYRKFTAGQPDNIGEACLELFVNPSDNNWGWNDFGCDQKLGFICQSSNC